MKTCSYAGVACIISILVILKVNTCSCEPAMILNLTQHLQGYEIRPNISYQLKYEVKASHGFIIPQCHSNQHNITLAESISQSRSTETSPSVGDIILPEVSDVALQLHSNESAPFSAYCFFQEYSHNAPVPGGCSLEFNFLNDPNIHTWYDGYKIWIQYQYASLSANDSMCTDTSFWSRLKYELYLLHFDVDFRDNGDAIYLSSLKHFLTADSIRKQGTQLMVFQREKALKPSVLVTSYPNQPVIVGLIVTDSNTQLSSAYVSTVSYGCDKSHEDSQHPCSVKWYMYLAAGILGVISLPIVFVGQRLFLYEIFYAGVLAALLVAYIGFTLGSVSFTGTIIGSTLLPLLGGSLWILFWSLIKKAIFPAMLMAADAGFLLGSIVFYTPLAGLSVFSNNWEIWIIMSVAMSLCVLLIVIRPKIMNIIFCVFLGSYAVVAAVSLAINATLHHIIVESIRRATINFYFDARFTSPFFARDYGLLALWLVLMVSGALIQYKLVKERDFPEPPSLSRLSLPCRKGKSQDEEAEEQSLINNQHSSTRQSNQPTAAVDYGSIQHPDPQ